MVQCSFHSNIGLLRNQTVHDETDKLIDEATFDFSSERRTQDVQNVSQAPEFCSCSLNIYMNLFGETLTKVVCMMLRARALIALPVYSC